MSATVSVDLAESPSCTEGASTCRTRTPLPVVLIGSACSRRVAMNGLSRRTPATMSSQAPATAFRSDAVTCDCGPELAIGRVVDFVPDDSIATPEAGPALRGGEETRAGGGGAGGAATGSVTRATLAGVSAPLTLEAPVADRPDDGSGRPGGPPGDALESPLMPRRT